MESFLDRLIKEIAGNHQDDFSDLCVVFPTRRAGVIFKKKLAGHFNKAAWLPVVYSVEDFFALFTKFPIGHPAELILELFTVHRQFFPETDFEKFYNWGEVLLNDFNEADEQMTDADKLFQNIYALKEIEERFGDDEQRREEIKSFWKIFSEKDHSKLKERFLFYWKHLASIYSQYRKQLAEKGFAYKGFALRQLAEAFTKEVPLLPWKKIYFAGFYALSKAEKTIVEKLLDSGKAEIIWDADSYYVDDRNQEAGIYFRSKPFRIDEKDFRWKGNYFESQKNITITGVPLQTGQAKYLGDELQKLITENKFYPDKTCIVLADEKMMFPVLYALPREIDKINITMGYPLKGSSIDNLIQLLRELQSQIRIFPDQHLSFKTDSVKKIFPNPFLSNFYSELLMQKIREADEHQFIHVTKDQIRTVENENLLTLLFVKTSSDKEVYDYLKSILSFLKQHHSENFFLSKPDSEMLNHVLEELEHLQRIISGYNMNLSVETAWKMLRNVISFSSIPFTGEPVEGLQIMGFLETRVLDFENVYVLSVNEGFFPKPSRSQSAIPFSLRKGFGLSLPDDHESIFAYHFYRLLQRAQNIHLLYNTEVRSVTGGERSRFILQLAYEMKNRLGEKLNLKHQVVQTDIHAVDLKEIVIEKDDALKERIRKEFLIPETARKISPTALTAYINCSLQYYFRYIAGLKEKEEANGDIDQALFGKIFHRAMELIYKPHKTLTSEIISKLHNKIDQTVDAAFYSEFNQHSSQLEGENLLLRDVISRLIRNILNSDKEDLPFEIIDLEKSIETVLSVENYSFRLYGTIDRADKTKDTTRIVDYKTGNDEMKDLNWEKIFSDSKKYKATFQVIYYAWLFSKSNPLNKLKAGIYRLKSASEGIQFLKDDNFISVDDINTFEEKLKELLHEIFISEKPFIQTKDKDKCRYCQYRNICNR